MGFAFGLLYIIIRLVYERVQYERAGRIARQINANRYNNNHR